eukprot:6194264-Alexandrium_andersonii.AAC.1
MSVGDRQHFRSEELVLAGKFEALKLLWGAAEDMKSYIAKFHEASVQDGASLRSATTNGLHGGTIARTLGSAPPCSLYEDLVPFSVPKQEKEE